MSEDLRQTSAGSEYYQDRFLEQGLDALVECDRGMLVGEVFADLDGTLPGFALPYSSELE